MGFPPPPQIYALFPLKFFLKNFHLKIYNGKTLQTAYYIDVFCPKQISSIRFGKVYVNTVLCHAGLKGLVAITYKNVGSSTQALVWKFGLGYRNFFENYLGGGIFSKEFLWKITVSGYKFFEGNFLKGIPLKNLVKGIPLEIYIVGRYSFFLFFFFFWGGGG